VHVVVLSPHGHDPFVAELYAVHYPHLGRLTRRFIATLQRQLLAERKWRSAANGAAPEQLPQL